MFCHKPITIKNPRWPKHGTLYIQVPCGKCLACIQRKATDWNFRLRSEVKNSLCSFFVTLTYNEENIPSNGVSKEDITLFLKRLRNYFPKESLRYFCIAEYGPTTFRPHYHGVFMFTDKSRSVGEFRQYLDKSWSVGFVSVSKVTPARIYYVCRYSFKPKILPEDKEKPFMSCSRRPAIGLSYLTEKKVLDLQEKKTDYVHNSGYEVRLPRYYKQKIFSRTQLDEISDQVSKKADEYFEKVVDKLGYEGAALNDYGNYKLWEKRQLDLFNKKNKRKL